jgi:hypothetical protein
MSTDTMIRGCGGEGRTADVLITFSPLNDIYVEWRTCRTKCVYRSSYGVIVGCSAVEALFGPVGFAKRNLLSLGRFVEP